VRFVKVGWVRLGLDTKLQEKVMQTMDGVGETSIGGIHILYPCLAIRSLSHFSQPPCWMYPFPLLPHSGRWCGAGREKAQ